MRVEGENQIRSVIPLAAATKRADLPSAYFVQSYLAFSLTAILAGVAAPHLGLAVTSYLYGGAVVLMALGSLTAGQVATSLGRER